MRVLLVTNGISSRLHRAFEMVRRLERAGHECLLSSHVDRSAEAAANGVPFRLLDADRGERDRIRLSVGQLRRPSVRWPLLLADTVGLIVNARRATTAADEVRSLMDEFDADVVVCDMESHVAALSVIAAGRPLVLTTTFFGVHEHPGFPPLGSESMPGEATLAAEWRAVRAAEAEAARRRRWTRRGAVDRYGPVPHAATSAVQIVRVARALGVDLDEHTDAEAWLRPHSYRGVPSLCCNFWELEFEHAAPGHWHYVGPLVVGDRIDAGVSDADRRRWAEVVRSAPAAELVVYASLGSYWATDLDLMRRIVAVAAARPEWRLIIGLGGRSKPDDLGALPANVSALGWAPQMDALRLADVAIVHGGSAAMNECVVAEVPLVVMSTGHLDQNGVAARVEHHGIGRRVASGAAAAEIDRAVAEVASDDAVRARLAELAELERSPARRSRVVAVIEAAAAAPSV